MDTFFISVVSAVTTTGLISCIVFLCRNWLIERLKASIKHEYDLRLENHKSDISRREKAALIAELVAEWTHPRESTKRLNQLLWELSLYLPSEFVKDLNATISKEQGCKPINDVLVNIRSYLLNGEDPIGPSDIRHFRDPNNPNMISNGGVRT